MDQIIIPKMRDILSRCLMLFFFFFTIAGCKEKNAALPVNSNNAKGQQIYHDLPCIQEYSIKYCLTENQQNFKLAAISSDRNGQIRILSDGGVLVPDNGSLFYSGKLIRDISYSPLLPKKISAINVPVNFICPGVIPETLITGTTPPITVGN